MCVHVRSTCPSGQSSSSYLPKPSNFAPSHLSRHARVAASMAIPSRAIRPGFCDSTHLHTVVAPVSIVQFILPRPLPMRAASTYPGGHSERGFIGPGESGPSGRDIRGGGGEERAPMQVGYVGTSSTWLKMCGCQSNKGGPWSRPRWARTTGDSPSKVGRNKGKT